MKAMKWEREFAALERMSVTQLRLRYGEVFGERTNGRNKAWLVKRIAWRLQAKAQGGLSERGRLRAEELAVEADPRMNPPPKKPLPGPRRRPAFGCSPSPPTRGCRHRGRCSLASTRAAACR